MSNEMKEAKKYGFAAFIPMFVFLGLYLGCGIFYTVTGTVGTAVEPVPAARGYPGGYCGRIFDEPL